MKLLIFYLIKGEAGKFQQKLVRDVGPKFNENYLIENPLPAHITLKYSFDARSLKKIEKFLENFSENQEPGKIKIRGFSNFNKEAVFLKSKFSRKAKRVQKNLVRKMDEKLNIKPKKFDLEFEPHSTIAYGSTINSFKKIWEYVNSLKKPKYDLWLDNLVLMKKVKSGWKIHKEFKLK